MVHAYAGGIVIEMHETMQCNQHALQCIRLVERLSYSMIYRWLLVTWIYAYSKYSPRITSICTS